MQKTGKFIISLDFELMWGVFDSKSVEDYQQNILGARTVIPQLLALFKKYEIGVTWATVGFLFFPDKNALLQAKPAHLPAYANDKYNVYKYLDALESDEFSKQLHFALPLIKDIQNCPNQEMATHTFSHYYCLEEGPAIDAFEADILSAKSVADKHQIRLQSIVFPRNQFNQQHIDICYKHGITNYRGTPDHPVYRSRKKTDEGIGLRMYRLLDSYINLSGHKCAPLPPAGKTGSVNLPGSDFLRPFSKKLKLFESLKVRRIKKSMDYAAKNNLMYHLWWHPHNFGIHQKENLKNLEEICMHFTHLKKKYHFESLTMAQAAASQTN